MDIINRKYNLNDLKISSLSFIKNNLDINKNITYYRNLYIHMLKAPVKEAKKV